MQNQCLFQLVPGHIGVEKHHSDDASIKEDQINGYSHLPHAVPVEENIQKGSSLATFLNHTDSKNLKELVGKEVDTELEGNFLCFKAY